MINKNVMKIKNLKTSTSVYLSLVDWERVKPTGYTPCLFRHALMPTPSQFGSVMVPCGWVEGIKPPLCQWQGSLFHWVEIFCIKVDDNRSLEELEVQRCMPISYPQWSCYCDSVPWVVMAVIQSVIQWHLWAEMSIPPPNACDPVDINSHYTLPEVFTHHQWMLWWTSMGEVVASHWSTPGRSFWPDTGWLPDHHLLVA